MKQERLIQLFNDNKTNELEFSGLCHDCKKETSVLADMLIDETIRIDGGAVYEANGEFYIKCDNCFQIDSVLRNYQPVETYSRVVGYMRPVDSWNKGKQEEFKKRKNYKIEDMVF